MFGKLLFFGVEPTKIWAHSSINFLNRSQRSLLISYNFTSIKKKKFQSQPLANSSGDPISKLKNHKGLAEW
jgi:hypothetical protein